MLLEPRLNTRHIHFSSKPTDRDHWDEVGVLVLERDEPPVTVVIALARVAVGW